MSCEAVREFLLQTDWDATQRCQAAEFLRHLAQCETCQAAVQDFDEIRLALAPAAPPVPAGGWDAMRQRLIESRSPRRRNWLRPALLMAASLAMIFGAFQMGRRATDQWSKTVASSKPAPLEPAAPPITPRELSREVRAFREISQVYEGHAGWLMVSDNDSDVGMSSSGPEALSRKVLMLRLQLLQGDQRVSDADLLVLAGQKADLTVPLPSGKSLHYRIGTSTDDSTRLTVWLELMTAHSSEPLAALATNLRVQPGRNLSAGKLATTAGDYELKIEFASTDLANNKP